MTGRGKIDAIADDFLVAPECKLESKPMPYDEYRQVPESGVKFPREVFIGNIKCKVVIVGTKALLQREGFQYQWLSAILADCCGLCPLHAKWALTKNRAKAFTADEIAKLYEAFR